MLRLFVSVADAHRVLCDFDQASLAALQTGASRMYRLSFKNTLLQRGKENKNTGAQVAPPSSLVIETFRIFPLTHITHKKTSTKTPPFTLRL